MSSPSEGSGSSESSSSVDAEDQDHGRSPALHDGAGDDSAPEINVNSLEELTFTEEEISAVQDSWRRLVASQGSADAVGEAVLSSLFEGAPSLQAMFTAPRAVQALKFATSMDTIVRTMRQPFQLRLLAETLGFEHMHIDVTVPRVVIFRDAVIDLLSVELGEGFSTAATLAWKDLMNYLGGAMIFVKEHFAERVKIIMQSWALANKSGDTTGSMVKGGKDSGLGLGAMQQEDPDEEKADRPTNVVVVKHGSAGNGSGGGSGPKGSTAQNDMTVPTTFTEMFQFNAAVMGLGDRPWLQEVIACFDNLVKSVANASRLQEECDVLMLRIAKLSHASAVNFSEYKTCMLASLRSLLPKDWTTAHESAWSWMWENVERLLKRNLANPRKWEQAWGKLLRSWDDETKYQVRTSIYNSFFTAAPTGQDYFKQSNTFLHFIADRVFDLTLELFSDPVKLVDDISALGLRHAGYGVPTELFSPYVNSSVEVVRGYASDEEAIDAYSWSLSLLAKMLGRTTTEGSTLVMRAINSNSQKQLIKALSSAPRGDRAKWMLLVQVGTQNISPLAWAISSGSQEAAEAIIADLLTIRADRERYYFGAGELFHRHPDIIQLLCNDAPALLNSLLDGLVWRSTVAENGKRRVNFFLEHLLVKQDGSMAQTIEWVSDFQDPKLACHPIVVMLSNLVWSNVAYWRFLLDKSWSLLTLVVFLTSQSIIEHLHESTDYADWERIAVFVCRAFIYLNGVPMFMYRHGKSTFRDVKANDFTHICGVKVPAYLDEWKELTSFFLLVALLLMVAMEPIFWCWQHAGNKIFEAHCEEADHIFVPYTVCSSIAVLLYFVVLVDLAVFSSRVSAFVLLCTQMTREVSLFLLALAGCLLLFSSAISVLEQDLVEFKHIPASLFTFLEIVTGTFPKSEYHHFEEEPIALLVVFLFLVLCVLFITDLLIAQLTCAYQAVYSDMLGYARLSQMRIITETTPYVSKKAWANFVESLRLDQKMEFNAGDIGLPGCIQVTEPANAHPTTVDRIRRYGGSTSRSKEWPAEDSKGGEDESDRLAKLEELVMKTFKKVKRPGRRGAGGTGTAGESGYGTGLGSSWGGAMGSRGSKGSRPTGSSSASDGHQ